MIKLKPKKIKNALNYVKAMSLEEFEKLPKPEFTEESVVSDELVEHVDAIQEIIDCVTTKANKEKLASDEKVTSLVTKYDLTLTQ